MARRRRLHFSWLIGVAIIAALFALIARLLAPVGDDAGSVPRPATSAPPRATTTTSVAPVPATFAVSPVESAAPSPVPDMAIGVTGDVVSTNQAQQAGRSEAGLLAFAGVYPSAFVTNAQGQPVRNGALLDQVRVSAGPPLVVEYDVSAKATWSDGTPIDCSDFVLAWLAGRGAPVVSGRPLFGPAVTDAYADVSFVSCPDGPKRVRVVFDQATATWTQLFSPLLPAHVVTAAAGVDAATAAAQGPTALRKLADAWSSVFLLGAEPGPSATVSGGPFAIVEWVPGQRLVLGRNPGWWGPTPALDRVVFRFYPSVDAQLKALQAGEVQVASATLTPAQADTAKAAGAVIEEAAGSATDRLVFNFRNPLLQSRALRQAVAECVPRPEIAAALAAAGLGTGTVLDSFVHLPFEAAYGASSGSALSFDIGAARAALTSGGWRPGGDGIMARPLKRVSFRLLHDGSDRSRAIVDRVRASCAKAGIEVLDDDAGSGPARDERIVQGDFDVALTASRVVPTPNGARRLYAAQGAENIGRYANPDTDSLFEAARTGVGDAATGAALERLDARLWQDVPAIPLTQPRTLVAHAPSLSGVAPNPLPGGLTWNLDRWSLAAG